MSSTTTKQKQFLLKWLLFQKPLIVVSAMPISFPKFMNFCHQQNGVFPTRQDPYPVLLMVVQKFRVMGESSHIVIPIHAIGQGASWLPFKLK